MLASCDTAENSETSAAKGSAKPTGNMDAMSASGLKVAYVNVDSLLSKYELVKELEDEIVQEKISLEGRFKAQVQQLENEFAYAQQEAPNLSPEKREMLQMEFAQKEQQLMMSKQQLEQQLLASEQKKNERLYKNIQDFLASYSSSNEFDFIFGYNGFGNVLYAADKFDITQTVLDSLNNAYNAENTELSEK